MVFNNNYAKLVDGTPRFLPVPVALTADITINGVTHAAGGLLYTDEAAALSELGYKPVTRLNMPVEAGYYYTDAWTDTGEAIAQSWTAHEIPVSDNASEQDYIDALTELGVNTDA